MSFALGGTSTDFLKEVPLFARYNIENKLLGYDRKCASPPSLPSTLDVPRQRTDPLARTAPLAGLYIGTTFRSTPHPKTGARTTYATSMSRFVIKHGRRTIPPYRAFALTGYGAEHGAQNWAVVQQMSQRDKLKWLVGDDEQGKGKAIVCGPVERGMEDRADWPGQVKIA